MDAANLQKRLGSAIRVRRVLLKFSQDGFADHIEMHRAYFSSIERGERNVTLSTIARVAAGLNLSIADLMAQAEI